MHFEPRGSPGWPAQSNQSGQPDRRVRSKGLQRDLDGGRIPCSLLSQDPGCCYFERLSRTSPAKFHPTPNVEVPVATGLHLFVYKDHRTALIMADLLHLTVPCLTKTPTTKSAPTGLLPPGLRRLNRIPRTSGCPPSCTTTSRLVLSPPIKRACRGCGPFCRLLNPNLNLGPNQQPAPQHP